jgi:hypothetical protein
MGRMTRCGDGGGRVAALALLVGAGLLAAGASRSAAGAEVRDFTVLVDGKPAGDYHLTVQPQDNGAVAMALQADVRVKVLGVTVYSYTYRGREVWKDGRLRRVDSSGQENGKPFAVSAEPDGGGLRVTCNGQAHPARPNVWTMTYWQLPPAPARDQPLPLLGSDGREVDGRLQYLGTERLNVAGQEQACGHYRVTGSTPHELWYDAQDRVVRQEWVVNGHKTVLELTRVGR